MLVCQLEIPLELNLVALRLAGRTVSPRSSIRRRPSRTLPEEIYRLSDVFCPNETETQLLTGMPVTTLEEAESAARVLLARGAGAVILTLGQRGSWWSRAMQRSIVPAQVGEGRWIRRARAMPMWAAWPTSWDVAKPLLESCGVPAPSPHAPS